jgi:hypothetical protein
MTKEKFEETCYRAYQLDWMISHGYTLLDLKEILTGLAVEDIEEDPLRSPTAETSIRAEADCVTERFLYDVGFDGSLYVCKDEFLGAEYQDEGYMRMLTGRMPDPEKMFALWLKYSGVENPSALEIDQVLTISTGHIDKETARELDREGSDTYGLVVFPKGEYGWWVYIPEKWEDFGDGTPWNVFKDRLPKGLADCIDLAVRNDCRWLCLDGSGDTAGLPEYDW